MKFIKKHGSIIAVLLFVLGTVFLFNREAHAAGNNNDSLYLAGSPHSITLGLSAGVAESGGVRTQRLSYRFENKWEYSYARVGGKGWNKTNYFSVSRIVAWRRDGRGPFLSIGAAYTDGYVVEESSGKPLVSERLTYELGLGYRWKLSPYTDVELRHLHNSTAGRSERNHGLDRTGLTYNWRF